MKAYLIDSVEKTVKEVEYNGGLEEMYKLMGCSMVSAPIVYSNEDTMFADDEGLYNPDNVKGSFKMKNWSYPIVGKVLVVGANEMGESVDVKTPIEYFTNGIIWIGEKETREHMDRFI